MIQLPSATAVGRVMPKEAFYKRLTLSSDLKEKFVTDVKRITISNSLTAATLNLEAGTEISEILVLTIDLKKQEFDGRIVENIARHFALRKKATRRIVLEAVSEIRPPLITATLAVIVSFLPMFFITGMMGPYMQPMALNVPVTMLMSMVVAFTITPEMMSLGYMKNSKETAYSTQPTTIRTYSRTICAGVFLSKTYSSSIRESRSLSPMI